MNLAETATQSLAVAYASVASELIPQRQLAKELHVHIKTLSRWHSLHIGPQRTKVGKAVFYRRSAVMRWLERNQGR
jgi:hypothetical protein